MSYSIEPGNRYAHAAGIDGGESTHLRDELSQFILVPRYGNRTDLLQAQHVSGVHKTRIHMLAGGINLLIIGGDFSIFSYKGDLLPFNKYDTILNHTIDNCVNGTSGDCKLSEARLFGNLALCTRGYYQYHQAGGPHCK